MIDHLCPGHPLIHAAVSPSLLHMCSSNSQGFAATLLVPPPPSLPAGSCRPLAGAKTLAHTHHPRSCSSWEAGPVQTTKRHVDGGWRARLVSSAPHVIQRVYVNEMCVLQSDAYSMCLICHNDLSQGSGGTRELQCTHTFHKEVTHPQRTHSPTTADLM